MSRVAIVTGGTRGIGAAISIALKNEGHKVAANYAGNDEAAAAFKAENGIDVYNGTLPTMSPASPVSPLLKLTWARLMCSSTMRASPATPCCTR